jgi:hypothetical protein
MATTWPNRPTVSILARRIALAGALGRHDLDRHD